MNNVRNDLISGIKDVKVERTISFFLGLQNFVYILRI